jgi:hypothetical protein
VLEAAGFQTEIEADEEHGTFEIAVSRGRGNARTLIDWALATHVEFQKAAQLYGDLKELTQPPFVISENGNSVSVASRVALLDSRDDGGQERHLDPALQGAGRDES